MDIYLTSLVSRLSFRQHLRLSCSFQRLCKLIRADKHAKEGRREARSLVADFRTRINEENEAKRVFSRLQEKKSTCKHLVEVRPLRSPSFIHSWASSRRVASHRGKENFVLAHARKGNPLINISYHELRFEYICENFPRNTPKATVMRTKSGKRRHTNTKFFYSESTFKYIRNIRFFSCHGTHGRLLYLSFPTSAYVKRVKSVFSFARNFPSANGGFRDVTRGCARGYSNCMIKFPKAAGMPPTRRFNVSSQRCKHSIRALWWVAARIGVKATLKMR